MPDDRFFPDPRVDALMGSVLGLTGEVLLLAARQRRLESATPTAGVDLDAPMDAEERGWLQHRAGQLVAAWLDPFVRGSDQPEAGGGRHDGGADAA